MWCFSVFLYLAILSHYSAVFVALAIGLYSIARIAESHLPRKVVVAWASGQAAALAIYGFLYVTHVSKVKYYIAVWASPFDGAYFRLDREDIFAFTWRNTSSIFRYIFGQRYIGQAMLLFFVVGVAVLFVRDLLHRRTNPWSCHSGILLLLPFIAAWGAAISGIYPYVGSRHTVFLAPFAIAAASFLLAAVYREKIWAGLLIAILIMGAANTFAETSEPFITKENQSRTLMIAAAHYMQQSIPRSDIILVDQQSSFSIPYYLCDPRVMIPIDTYRGAYYEFSCNGYSIVSFPEWKVLGGSFPSQFEKMALAHGLKSGDRVWVFQNGWGVMLDRELMCHFPQFRCLTPKGFGDNITVIPFVVGPDLFPAAPETNCAPPVINSATM
jgi:hypothetical protein